MDQSTDGTDREASAGRRSFDRVNQWLTLAANLGVIAGLLILAYEIQQNTSIARASAYRDHVQDIAAWREMTIVNPDVSRIYGVYVRQGLDALEVGDQGRASGMINNIMGSYENAWFAWRYDVLDDEQWQRFRTGACIHFKLAHEQGLNLRFITDPYREYLTQHCDDQDRASP